MHVHQFKTSFLYFQIKKEKHRRTSGSESPKRKIKHERHSSPETPPKKVKRERDWSPEHYARR